MAVKRSGQDEQNFEGGAQSPPQYHPSGASSVAQDIFMTRPILGSAFPAGEPKPEKPGEEKISLFWRVFGGTILSIAALAIVTMYNSVATNISEVRANLAGAQADSARCNADLRAELNRVHEASGERLRVAEFNTRMTTVWDGIKSIQTQGAAQSAQLAAQKSEIDANKERLAKQGADTDAIRRDFGSTLELLKKEQVATTDAIKKDVAALDNLKERLAALTTELKAAGAELKAVGAEATKTRQQLDANQVQDAERKANRDKQFKALDDAVMGLSKTIQDSREKIARLEAQAAPKPAPAPAPAAPAKKPSVSRPAKPTPTPVEEEEKPEEWGE